MWFSNVQFYNDEIPEILFQMLPAPITLQQGAKSAGDQFRYSMARTDEGDHMLYFASFNLSFAVAGITALDRTIYLETRTVDHMPVFVPGFAR